MKKWLAFLCALALLLQPMALTGTWGYAHAEDVATPGDVPAICEACGEKFDAQSSWMEDDDGTHVICCIHGVKLETSRHASVNSWNFEPYDETLHARICGYAGCDLAIGYVEHTARCSSPTTCETCGATDITPMYVNHDWPDRDTCTYLYNSEKHWAECLGCGVSVYEGGHFASCTNPGVCKICGQTDVTFAAEPSHTWDYEVYDWNSVVHWYVCQDCGGKYMMSSHWADCDDPTTCVECGATGITAGLMHVGDVTEGHDNTWHWDACSNCGIFFKEKHFAYCDDPTTCALCGAENITASSIEHQYDADEAEYLYDANYHWVACMNCGEAVYGKEAHFTTCLDKGGPCVICGQPVPGGAYEHWNDHDELISNADEHWYVCGACGEVWNRESHVAMCDNPGVCWLCGEVTDAIEHAEWGDTPVQGTDTHWWVCLACGERVNEKTHEPSKDDPTKCGVCGAAIPQPTAEPTTVPTAEPTEAPTAEPTAEPTVSPTPIPLPTMSPVPTAAPTAEPTEEATEEPTAEPTVAPTAEPTEAPTEVPTEAPTRVPAPVVTPEPVHEHTYDDAFVSNGDGTHSKACLSGCGEVITEDCQLVTTDMGLMTCTACAKCGYAVYAAKAGISALNEGESVPAVVVRVESATIAAAEEAPAVPERAVLVVHETTFEVPVTLPEEIKGTVEKVFTAALLLEGEDIQPAGAVKLTIPVDEDTLASLEGKVLMLLRADGTLVEVPFEVIDGQLVFLTEELGVFLLMEPEAAEAAA